MVMDRTGPRHLDVLPTSESGIARRSGLNKYSGLPQEENCAKSSLLWCGERYKNTAANIQRGIAWRSGRKTTPVS